MQEHPYTPDPSAETAWVIQTFLDAVEQHLADASLMSRLRRCLDADRAALESKYQPWLVNEQARHHLHLGATVLVTYRLLREAVPEQELLALLKGAFTEPFREAIGRATVQWLDQSADPFQMIVGVSKQREALYFGDSFVFERPREDDRAYYADVTRCLWHSFFVAEGKPELTPILCAFDENWIAAIDPERHGVRFERATTLGHGGSLCPFHFFRIVTSAA